MENGSVENMNYRIDLVILLLPSLKSVGTDSQSARLHQVDHWCLRCKNFRRHKVAYIEIHSYPFF